jgi:hypothetical protein
MAVSAIDCKRQHKSARICLYVHLSADYLAPCADRFLEKGESVCHGMTQAQKTGLAEAKEPLIYSHIAATAA